MHATMTGDTRYYGIWVQREVREHHAHYWIMDANGGEEYCGTDAPTQQAITDYRNQIVAR